MKGLCVLNHERQERYVAPVVNTVKIYGLRIVNSYHYGSTDSTGITSTVISSYCCFWPSDWRTDDTGATGIMFGDEGVVCSGVMGPLPWVSEASLWSNEGVFSALGSCFAFSATGSCEGTSCRVPSGAILQYLWRVKVSFT